MTMNREPEALIDMASEYATLTDDDYLLPEDWQDYADERMGDEDAFLDSYWEGLYEA